MPSWREALATIPTDAPLVPILVYRSGVAAGDTAMVEAIAATLAERGLSPLPLALTSLKDASVAAELAVLITTRKPALIVTTTAFSARDGDGFVLDPADCPILQAVPVGSARMGPRLSYHARTPPEGCGEPLAAHGVCPRPAGCLHRGLR